MLTREPESSVASQRIASEVRDEILRGKFAPGERILQGVIADRFGASRLPVREAFRILESDGLVTLVANTGAWIASMSENECAETYKMRERLEPLLLLESMAHLTDEDVDRLGLLATQMEQTQDVEAFLSLDREFHLLSYKTADMPLLSATVQRLWNTTQHYRRVFSLLTDVANSKVTHFEHHLLVDAIRRSDPKDAAGILESHIRRTRIELSRHPEVFR